MYTWRRYRTEIWRESFALFEQGERIAKFASLVIGSVIFALLVVLGVSVTFDPIISLWVSALFVLWLLLLVFVVSPYRVWKKLGEENENLQNRLAPKLSLNFDQGISGCIRETEFQGGSKARFFRVMVESKSSSPLLCSGHLIDVKRSGARTDFGESLRLTFAPGEGDDALEKRLVDKVPEFLDIGFITEGGQFGLGTKGRRIPIALKDLFSDEADYTLTVVVAPQNAGSSETIALKLRLTGDWKTTAMEHLPG